MPGVRQKRQRIAQPTADDLDHHVAEHQDKGPGEPPGGRLSRSVMVMSVGNAAMRMSVLCVHAFDRRLKE